MSILAKREEIELVVTYKCNWVCEYCCVDTHNQKPISFEEIVNKLSLIDNKSGNVNVTISGGEPGLLSKETLQYIIEDLLNKKIIISVNTNGVIIEKYPELLHNFDEILYHCSENLQTDILETRYNNIQYMLVVTDNNYQYLDEFLNKYKDIMFNIVPATNPEDLNNVILSNKNKYRILTKHYKQLTIESRKRIISEKDFDAIEYI